jgi:hypothetical protein
MSKIEDNEKREPDLIRLRNIVEDKNETEDRRWKAAFCYSAIVLAMNTQGYYTPK